jgi:hypothetical protein
MSAPKLSGASAIGWSGIGMSLMESWAQAVGRILLRRGPFRHPNPLGEVTSAAGSGIQL